jgi:hypothetical protein
MKIRELLRFAQRGELVAIVLAFLMLFTQTALVGYRAASGPDRVGSLASDPAALGEEAVVAEQLDATDGKTASERRTTTAVGESGATGTVSDPGTFAPGVVGRVSEIGVNDKFVQMGFVTAPCGDGGASAAGFDSLAGNCKRDQGIVNAFLADWNKTRTHGRKIVPIFREVDPFSDESIRSMCTYFAKQVKVLAVVVTAGPFGPPILCLTKDNRIPYLSWDAEPDEWYEQSRHDGLPYYMTFGISKSRTMRQWVEWGRTEKWFPKTDTFGVLSTEYPGDKTPVDNALKPQLKKRNIHIRREVRFAQADNIELLTTQMAAGVQAMQQDGITHIYMGVNLVYATLWMQAAEKQNYFPTYSFNDFASISTEFAADFFPPDSWDGVKGITSYLTGDPRVDEPGERLPNTRKCEAFVKAKTGEDLDQAPIAVLWCQSLWAMHGALLGAGPRLTRDAYVKAMVSLGDISGLITTSEGGIWSMAKADAPINVATIRWDSSCPVRPNAAGDRPGCYHQIKPFRSFYPE